MHTVSVPIGMQAFVHEEQEFQTGVDSGRFKRRLRLTKEESPKPAEDGPVLPVEQVISAYVTRLQLRLQVIVTYQSTVPLTEAQ